MDTEYFKDKLFDLLNEADDIESDDRKNVFKVFLQNGGTYEIKCRPVSE